MAASTWWERFRRRAGTSGRGGRRWSLGRRGGGPGAVRGGARGNQPDRAAEVEHLRQWAQARRGVEGFVEPRTTLSEVTLLLVAHDGEWTRRRVASVEWAHRFANDLGLPSYDAAVVGVPKRMREYNRRHHRRGN